MDDVASPASSTAAITILALAGISLSELATAGFVLWSEWWFLLSALPIFVAVGDIDEAVYASIAIFGFIELLVEIALLASVLGK